MVRSEPMTPDDELQGLLRNAVEQVRREPVSEDLIEGCAARAVKIPDPEGARLISADFGRDRVKSAPTSWRWPATVCLAASLLITLSLNALQFGLDRPDPHRQQAAVLTMANQQSYCIYSDLRLERAVLISAAH